MHNQMLINVVTDDDLVLTINGKYCSLQEKKIISSFSKSNWFEYFYESFGFVWII